MVPAILIVVLAGCAGDSNTTTSEGPASLPGDRAAGADASRDDLTGSGGSSGSDDGGVDTTTETRNTGVCGKRGEATVSSSDFQGFEELFVLGDEGFGQDVCVVRYDVRRVGDAPDECTDLMGTPCLWAHEVAFGDPQVLVDIDGACARSDLTLDPQTIDAIAGTHAAYGFVSEYVGHNSVLLTYDLESGSWNASGNATWDEATQAFRFDNRTGLCRY